MSDEWLPSFAESICTVLGVAVPMICNYALKRPFSTGPQYHIIGAAIGYGIGHQATRIMDEVQRKNLLHMEDYMRQYPERFADLQPRPQYHIIGAAIGYGIGHQATRIMDEVQRKNLLHMEDYMRQYPERFADLQPSDKKWKDVIQDWHPYR